MIRSPHKLVSAALFAWAFVASSAVSSPVRGADAVADSSVKLTLKDDRIVVEVGGKPFTEYHFAAEAGKPYARPYFYPVKAADGIEITSDQVVTNPKEHPHHRSIWVAQGDVNGVDHWTHGKTGNPAQQRHLKFQKVEGDTIVEELAWDDKDGKPMLNETRTWKVKAYPDGARALDLTSVYTPAAGPVTFGDTKEAGLASVRLNKAISDTSVITMASGTVSKSSKTEKEVWGKPADWCDLSGKIDGKEYGAAVFDHPSNPRHPTNWHVRHYGLLSANIFGLHDFDKAANPEGAGAMKLEPGKPTSFRYLIVIHTGDAESAKLKEKYAQYIAGK